MLCFKDQGIEDVSYTRQGDGELEIESDKKNPSDPLKK